MDYSPLFISLRTSVMATAVTLILGVSLAWIVETRLKRSGAIVDGLLTLPMILPPTVVGFFLLLAFGRNGLIGGILFDMGYPIIFTWQATVIAATVVSFPLMYKGARGAFAQIDRNVLDAARLLGAGEMKVLLKVAMPMAWPGIAAGTVLSFARALGEFGATLMVAGNIPGKTQTIPIAIFFAAESGNMERAYIWVGIIFAISLSFILLLNLWTERQARAGGKAVSDRI